jgi:hypothetical protein
MIWTHYGRWTDDGYRVLNAYGGVAYERPDSPNLRKKELPPVVETLEEYMAMLERMKL